MSELQFIQAELGILLGVLAYAWVWLFKKLNRIERYLQRQNATMGLPRDVDAPSIAQQTGDA